MADEPQANSQPEYVPLCEDIVEYFPYPLCVINVDDYMVVYANQAARAGQPAFPVTCYALVHRNSAPCQSAEHPCPLEVVARTGRPVVLTHTATDRLGRKRDIEIHGYPVFDGSGQVRQIIEYAIDTTERQRTFDITASLLSASRAVVEHRSFQQAASSIYTITRELIGASAGYVALLDISGTGSQLVLWDAGEGPQTSPQVLSPSLNDLLDEAYRVSYPAIFNDLTTDPTGRPVVKPALPHTNILLVPLKISGIAVGVLALADKPEGFQPADATAAAAFAEQMAVALLNSRALDTLSTNAQRFSAVVETASDAIISADACGQITGWNRAAHRIFDCSPGEAIGRSLADFFVGRFDDAAATGVRAVAVRSPTIMNSPAELLGRRRDGSLFPVELSLAGWQMDGEDYFTAIVRDISERKQIEREQQQLIQDLEAFAHTVAHDLKSPLSVVSGYTELMLDEFEDLSEEERDLTLRTMYATTHKMVNIVDELLLLARLRSSEVTPVPLEMGFVVKEACQRLDYLIRQHGGTIESPSRWPRAMGYGPWIEEVWVNYISNALKYGGRPPAIRLGARKLPENMICYWVKDNGPGLSPTEIDRLFTMFTPLDQVQAKGHGLGLSIVRRIIDKLGGEVGVNCPNGQGCQFYFTLPAAE
jgi:PAS domain S-box-containing protein